MPASENASLIELPEKSPTVGSCDTVSTPDVIGVMPAYPCGLQNREVRRAHPRQQLHEGPAGSPETVSPAQTAPRFLFPHPGSLL